MLASLQQAYASERMVVGTLGNTHVTVYRGRFTMQDLHAATESHQKLQDRYDHTCIVSIAEPGTPLPDGEMRAEATRLTKVLSPKVRRAIMVLDGQGFWASAVRSATTAILMMAGNPYPIKVVKTYAAGAAFLEPDLIDVESGDALGQAMTALRSQ